RRRPGVLAQLIEKRWLQGAWIEDGLEPSGRQLLNLARRQGDAVPLRDARFDLPDDLVDVDRVGLVGLARALAMRLGLALGLGLLRLGPSIASAIGAAPAAM